MNAQTDYMNGGVMVNLLKLFITQGYVPSEEQAQTIAAHDSMPRGRFYTDADVDAAKAQTKAAKWMDAKDGYEDLYGDLSTIDARPKRMSAYDRKHSTR
jgi:hypothetical protein